MPRRATEAEEEDVLKILDDIVNRALAIKQRAAQLKVLEHRAGIRREVMAVTTEIISQAAKIEAGSARLKALELEAEMMGRAAIAKQKAKAQA